MRQLVGQGCVHCRERIPSELDGRFCPACGCPTHDHCRTAKLAAPPVGGSCPSCGASPADVAAHSPGTEQDIREQAKRDRPRAAGTVGFASEQRVRRGLKVSWFDDRGAVEPVPGGVQFVGEKAVVVMRDVASVEVVGPILPWGAVGGLIAGNALALAMSAGGAFQVFTIDNPWTYVMLGAINLVGLRGCPVRWVRVAYKGERPGVAYLAPALGLSRWTGGTHRLAAQVRELVGHRAAGETPDGGVSGPTN